MSFNVHLICLSAEEAKRIAKAAVKQSLAVSCLVSETFTRIDKEGERAVVDLQCRVTTDGLQDAVAFLKKKSEALDPEISIVSLYEPGQEAVQIKTLAKETVQSNSLNSAVINLDAAKNLHKSYLAAQPFPRMRLKNAFSESLLEDVFDSLAKGGDFEPRSNDLYRFSQSPDLRAVAEKMPRVKELAEALYSDEMLAFVSQVTGIKLNNMVDMSATLYTQGCHLLTHDDRMTTRRVAFIVYLTPKIWSDKDGGHLRFFSSEMSGFHPDPHQFDQWLPEWNTFAFFTVSHRSYHQVCEITSQVPRVAISGWFHGDPLDSPEVIPALFPTLISVPKSQRNVSSSKFTTSVRPEYLSNVEITKKMRRRGAVLLNDFFSLDSPNAFDGDSQNWIDCGPLHMQYYQQCVAPKGFLADISQLLQSSNFREYCQSLLGVELELESVEMRRFLRGKHYTLLHDAIASDEQEYLEVCYCLTDPQSGPELEEWDLNLGGFVCYVDSQDESGDELMTIFPQSNTLSVALLEPGIQSFVKFLSSYAPADRYDIVLKFKVGDPIESMQMEISSEEECDEEDEEEGDEEEAVRPSKKSK